MINTTKLNVIMSLVNKKLVHSTRARKTTKELIKESVFALRLYILFFHNSEIPSVQSHLTTTQKWSFMFFILIGTVMHANYLSY